VSHPVPRRRSERDAFEETPASQDAPGRRALDALETRPLDSAPQPNMGIDRDEYPSSAISETRRLV